MKTCDVINVDVTNNGTPYTNGVAIYTLEDLKPHLSMK
jgi:hypothetical protein